MTVKFFIQKSSFLLHILIADLQTFSKHWTLVSFASPVSEIWILKFDVPPALTLPTHTTRRIKTFLVTLLLARYYRNTRLWFSNVSKVVDQFSDSVTLCNCSYRISHMLSLKDYLFPEFNCLSCNVSKTSGCRLREYVVKHGVSVYEF